MCRRLQTQLSNAELSQIIDNRIRGANANRNRKILKSKLIDGYTYEQLEEIYLMSSRQIQRIVNMCMEELKDYI